MITVTGGKLTTYREMAEDTVDELVDHLDGLPRSARRCRTARLQLRGAQSTDAEGHGHGPAPRRPVRQRGGGGAGADRCRPSPRRAARRRASPTCEPRRCTPRATRWPRPSTTCSPGAPAPGCRRVTRPRPPAPAVGALLARRARLERRGDRPAGRGLRRARRGRAGRPGPRRHRRRLRGRSVTAPHELPAPGPGAPTAPIGLRDGGAGATGRLAATAVPVPDARHRPPVVDLPHHHRRRRRRRGQPRLVAPGDDLGPRRAGAGRGPARSCPPPPPSEVARRAGGVQRGRHPGHRGRRPQRRVRSVGAAARRCGARPVRLRGHRRRRRARRSCSTWRPAPSATTSSTSCAASTALTLGHWPQSVALSTVGGWLACRSAGQLSTRYGKIEDMVLGLDVALADGRRISTGGAPRAAVGPDLNQLFVGSEGTLGIITGARLRLHPAPVHERRCAYAFASFEDGLDAMRRILQRGGTPGRAPPLRRRRGRPHLQDRRPRAAARARRGRGRRRRRHDGAGGRGVPGGRARRPGARRPLAGAPQRRRRPRGADLARLRGRHDGGRRPLARPAGHLRRDRRGPPSGGRHAGGVGPPVAQLHRRRLPLLHVRGQDRARRPRPLLPGGVGRRHACRARAPAARCRTTTAWG